MSLTASRTNAIQKLLKKRFLITFLPDTAAREIICESNLSFLCQFFQRYMTSKHNKRKDTWLESTIITFEKVSKWSESKNGLLYIINESLR